MPKKSKRNRTLGGNLKKARDQKAATLEAITQRGGVPATPLKSKSKNKRDDPKSGALIFI